MAKKKSILGKMIAFTTTVAAIGGVCYVFRDKIKESSVYHGVVNGLSSLMGKHDKYTDDDDFLFDDDNIDDIFDSNDKGREYTSIIINKSDDEEPDKIDTSNTIVINEAVEVEEKTGNEEDNDTKIPNEADDSDSISVFGASIPEAFSTAAADENEGLSDFDDDPDVLADQDKLDF